MSKKEIAGGSLCTDEQRLLISRATELSRRGENSAVALSFLTPLEQRLVFEAIEKQGCGGRLFMWGGCVGCERRLGIFLPEWLSDAENIREPLFSSEREKHFLGFLESMGMESLPEDFISCIRLYGSGYENLSHRDILGALMALGIKRSVLGDIYVTDSGAYLFCENRSCDFIVSELKRAGRDTVRCEKAQIGSDFCPVRNFKEISTTVASVRLDGTVRALCNISRDEALRMVTQGLCEVNYFTEKEPDRRILGGDIISVRGYGKYIVDRAEDVNRRGRIRLLARKYV